MNNPLKLTFKTEFPSIVIIISSIIASIYFYSHFPERVITHWNYMGQADGWSSRGFAAFFFPAMIIGMYLLFIILPLFDPKKERYEEFKRTYQILRQVFILFFFIIFVIASLNNLGVNISVSTWVPGLIGLLFMVLGNYMGKLKSNWMIGMRNAWTLSNEEVWNKTNRLTGKLFVVSGVLMIVDGFVPKILVLPILVIAILIVVIIPTVYSYLLYRRIGAKKLS